MLVWSQAALSLTTKGKFSESIQKFRSVLFELPLLVVESKNDVTEAQQVNTNIFWFCLCLSLDLLVFKIPTQTSHLQFVL
jgi:hypothetical protein